MALGLAGDGGLDRGNQRAIVIGVVPQGTAQICIVFLPETHVQLTSAGEADAVAALAEIMGQRRDEPDALPGIRQSHITGRAPGPVWAGRFNSRRVASSARKSLSDQY